MLTILGSLLGGIFRLAPEFFKLWDRQNDRKHELAMMNVELQIAEKKLQATMYTTDAAMHTADMEAVTVALQEQGETARAAGKTVAAISALVRPIVTYWLVALYSAVKVACMSLAYQQSASWQFMLKDSWSEYDGALLSTILTFWFVGRVWERVKK